MSDLLGTEYEALFEQLLKSHLAAAAGHARAPVNWCGFWPMIGRKFRPGGVVVVGRALNGWEDSEFTGEALNQPGGTKDLIRRCRESFAPADKCPMAWVEQAWQAEEGYRTSRSQFWQTARRLAANNGCQEEDWPSTLAWTNLMRVSPASGGNPPDWSYFAQLEPAARLLDYELRSLQPSVAVFLTGRAWYAPFQEKTDLFHLEEIDQEYVHYAGQHGQTRLIVSDHPQTRSPDRIVEQIVKHWPQT